MRTASMTRRTRRQPAATRPLAGTAWLAALAATLMAAPLRAQEDPMGAPVAHTFERAPFRSSGLERLEHLRGAPVWIEYWSSTALSSYAVTVPTAIKLQEKHGDDVQVLCVEVGGMSHDEMARFVLEYRWAGGRTLWTTELPSITSTMVPWAAVLGPGGELVAFGNSMEDAKTLTDALEDALEARRKGPPGTPGAVRKAWGELSKGRLGRALGLAREAAAKAAGKDGDVVAAAGAAEAAVLAAAEARLARAASMFASGHYADAAAFLERLAEAVKGDEALAGRVAELRAALDGEQAEAELAADAKLGKLERKLYDKGPDDRLADQLLELSREAAGMQAAERARELAALARED
jgi:hypothetical protein